MDGRVLPDLERRQVEPERADLPAEVGYLAPGDPREAVRRQRFLEFEELLVQLGGCRVPTRARRRLAGQRGSRPPQPFGHEPEPLPVRLLGESTAELAIGLGELLGIAGEPVRERAGDEVRGGGRGHGLHEPGGHGLVAVQDVVGLDPDRALRDVGGDARVAVAVAPDPAAPVQVRPDARRPRPGPAGVRGRARDAAPGRDRVQRPVEHAVQPRDQREQRPVEERHGGSRLIERRGRHRPQVGRPPQERDLLAQAAADVAVLRPRQPRVVEPLEEQRAAAQRHERGPAPRLRRVRRQDERDRERPDERIEVFVGPSLLAELGDGLGQRVVEDAVPGGPLAASQRPHSPARLHQVHQLEVERERRDDRLGRLQVELGEVGVELGALLGIVVLTQRDGPPPDALHEVEDLRPGLLHDHLAEQRAEQPHLGRERVVRAGGPDPARLGADLDRRSAARGGTHAAPRCGPDRVATFPSPQPFSGRTFPTLVR